MPTPEEYAKVRIAEIQIELDALAKEWSAAKLRGSAKDQRRIEQKMERLQREASRLEVLDKR